jgi:hypothetical protein
VLGKVGGAVKGGIDKLNDLTGGGSMLVKSLLAAAIWKAMDDEKHRRDLQSKGLSFATDAYSAKSPLRRRGLELAQDESAPDVSRIFVNPQKPYNKPRVPYQLSAKAPIGAPVMPPQGSTY